MCSKTCKAPARTIFAAIAVSVLAGCVSQQQPVLELGSTQSQPAEQGLPLTASVIPAVDAGTGQPVLAEDGSAFRAAVPFSPRSTAQADLQPVAGQASSGTQTASIAVNEPVAQVAGTAINKPVVEDNPSNTGLVTAENTAEGSAGNQTSELALVSTEQAARPVTQTKQPSFFQRLFKSSSTTNSTLQPQSARSGFVLAGNRTPTPTKTTPRPTVSITEPGISSANATGALPGVKSNSQLFGINDAEIEEAEGLTELAAVGSFGTLSPNGLRVQHEKVRVACLKPGIIRILRQVERKFRKKPIITSGYRDPKRNRRAGGARNSMHIYCKAVDIQVEGVSKRNLATYLRSLPGRGGVGTYCRTKSVHVDTGKKRDWHYPCRKSSLKKRKKA